MMRHNFFFSEKTSKMPPQGNDIKHKNVYTRLHSATAHDWEAYKNKDKDICDDGTMTFFW